MFGKNKIITKVIWKTKFTPKNAPVSKVLSDEYEVTSEFKVGKEDLIKLEKQYTESHSSQPDREEIFHSIEDQTNFDIKIKTIHCDYEQLKQQIGYEPDALEFDQHVKKLIKDYQKNVLNKTQSKKVS